MMNSSISGFSVPSDVPLTQRNEVVAEQLTHKVRSYSVLLHPYRILMCALRLKTHWI